MGFIVASSCWHALIPDSCSFPLHNTSLVLPASRCRLPSAQEMLFLLLFHSMWSLALDFSSLPHSLLPWGLFLISWSPAHTPKCGTTGVMWWLYFQPFEEPPHRQPQWIHKFKFSPAVYKSFLCPPTLAGLCCPVLLLFDANHSDWSEVVKAASSCIFLITKDAE